MLRAVAWASALSGVTSAVLLGALFLVRPLSLAMAWVVASAVVILAAFCVGGFAWMVLSLPPGAPLRRMGLRTGVALLAMGLAAPFVLGSRGEMLLLAFAAGSFGLANAWRPDWRVLGWAAIGAGVGVALLGGSPLFVAAGAALALASWMLGREP